MKEGKEGNNINNITHMQTKNINNITHMQTKNINNITHTNSLFLKCLNVH